MEKKINSTYLEKYHKKLNDTVQNYRENVSSYNLFASTEYAIFNTIEKGITKFHYVIIK